MANTEPSGKVEKALDRLRATRDEAYDIKRIIRTIAECLPVVVGEAHKELDPDSEQERNKLPKLRGMISGLPSRIEFSCYGLRFYIDFTLLFPEGAGPTDLRGSIIYGANRTLCFRECDFTEDECKRCQRINRCDGLEDKPLVQFTVDRHGMVKSMGELDDEWRIEGTNKKRKLLEMHCRTLDYIWKDALNWTNENILP